MRFTGGAAFSAWESTGDAAARIEQLELRLELEKTRNTVKELSAMLADCQQDNQRLKQRICTVTGERPAPVDAQRPSAIAAAYVVAPDAAALDAQRPPATTAAHGIAPYAAAKPSSPLLQSLIAAANLQAHGRPLSTPTWVNSLQEQQHQRFATNGARDQVMGAGRRGLRSSCEFCTRSKIRCDGRKPTCGNCQARRRCCYYSEKRRPGPRPSRSSEAMSQPASPRRRLTTTEPTDLSLLSAANTHAPHTTLRTESMGGLSSLLLASSLTHSATQTHAHTHADTHRHTNVPRGAAASEVPASELWSISFDHAQVESSARPSPLRTTERRSFRF